MSPDTKQPQPQSAGRGSLGRDLGRYSGLGLTLAMAIALFGWAGYALDQRLGTLPLFLLIGVFAGAGAGTYSLVLKVNAGTRADRESQSPENQG